MAEPRPKSQFAAAFDLSANLRALLHRPAQQAAHFAPIDGLRARSLLWVIVFHVTNEFGRKLPREDQLLQILRRGFLGVDVFFVISGFLIGYLVLREQRDRGSVDAGRFFYRRALRMLPAYWLTLVIYAVLLGPNVDNVGWNLVFLNNFLPSDQQCMSWAWSLAVEEQFYLVFPGFVWLLHRVPQRRRLLCLLAMLVLAFCVRGAVVYFDQLYVPGFERDQRWLRGFYMHTHVRYGALLCGVSAAYLLLHTDVLAWFRRTRLRVPLLVLAAATIIDMVARRQFATYGWPLWFNWAYLTSASYLFALGIACVMLACVAGVSEVRWLSRFLQARWLYPIGQLSYSSYLVHLLVIQALSESRTLPRAETPGELACAIVLVAVATFGVAAAMYLGIERPFMNLRDARRAPRHVEKTAFGALASLPPEAR